MTNQYQPLTELNQIMDNNKDLDQTDGDYIDSIPLDTFEITQNDYYKIDNENEIQLNMSQLNEMITNNVNDDENNDVINNLVVVPKEKSFSFKQLRSFLGPALLVSVGYLDPGNWATDIEGGSRFGTSLLWVLLFSNIIALLLQTLVIRVSLVTGLNLAQMCAKEFQDNKIMRYSLWLISELSIISTDLAEVIGTAIGLKLLFNVPMIAGVIITAVDTLLFLLIQRFGPRKLEFLMLLLLSAITSCFIVELFLCKPSAKDVFKGFVPSLNRDSVFIATSIVGATVMPHNLFLHSGIVNSRSIGKDMDSIKQACKYNIIDTFLALNCAFFVNASILILSATVFYANGIEVTELADAHKLLGDLLNSKVGSVLFGVALLLSGQSSTIGGTMAGQIVMEGFVQIRVKSWLRRLITRSMAIVPAVVIILAMGEGATYKLLISSQVVLSIALPFAVIPLIQFTSRSDIMSDLRSPKLMLLSSISVALFIIILNFMTIYELIHDLLQSTLAIKIVTSVILIPIVFLLFLLLLYLISYRHQQKILKYLLINRK
ncbi:natural resistance-associated macrophage protein [Tieghemostelium lacteum]|uniref:Natural resistance-associated macrophage protein n=1 Tax=Tieghemostelium lacteum TaxID=361077 RepID=A0A151ZBJ1_TIELA|nr:natural resistance-associated macrophage protein [Tieghemostelium lacteum]|eukprot:KYQ91317.1 natural resistance-associated macrophage protein [Tieghemostelium lacteum]